MEIIDKAVEFIKLLTRLLSYWQGCWEIIDKAVEFITQMEIIDKAVEFIKLVASLLQACSNLSTSLGQPVRAYPVNKLLKQTCYKSAAGLLQVVRFYVCTSISKELFWNIALGNHFETKSAIFSHKWKLLTKWRLFNSNSISSSDTRSRNLKRFQWRKGNHITSQSIRKQRSWEIAPRLLWKCPVGHFEGPVKQKHLTWKLPGWWKIKTSNPSDFLYKFLLRFPPVVTLDQ